MTLQSSILLLCIATAGGYTAVALFTRVLFAPAQPKNIAGFRLQGLIPSIAPSFADVLASAVQEHLRSSDILGRTIDDPGLLEQLRPEMEAHIDLFLKDKLPIAFPLLANMMGEKTKATLKGAFLEEVETIFPAVMKSFSGKLMTRLQPAALIEEKLREIDWLALEKIMHSKAARQILRMKLAGAGAGFLVGRVQVIVLCYMG
jgi:uncharacterized membrane protein YheB (UPF0754 family)